MKTISTIGVALLLASASANADFCDTSKVDGMAFQMLEPSPSQAWSYRHLSSSSIPLMGWFSDANWKDQVDLAIFEGRDGVLQEDRFIRKHEIIDDKMVSMRYYPAHMDNCESIFLRIPESAYWAQNASQKPIMAFNDGPDFLIENEHNAGVRFDGNLDRLRSMKGRQIYLLPRDEDSSNKGWVAREQGDELGKHKPWTHTGPIKHEVIDIVERPYVVQGKYLASSMLVIKGENGKRWWLPAHPMDMVLANWDATDATAVGSLQGDILVKYGRPDHIAIIEDGASQGDDLWIYRMPGLAFFINNGVVTNIKDLRAIPDRYKPLK